MKYVVRSYPSSKDSKNHFLSSLLPTILDTLVDKEKVLIFLPSIDGIDDLAKSLEELAVPHCKYYAALEDKSEQMIKWMTEETVRVMVASSAFGLGIDFPYVRHVVCLGLPYSLDDYFQQSGRASRDGKPGVTTLLTYTNEYAQRSSRDNTDDSALSLMNDYCTAKDTCRRRFLSRYFDTTEVCCDDFRTSNLCDVCSVLGMFRTNRLLLLT
jgi:ATP-dependent DNA helicase RecQ